MPVNKARVVWIEINISKLLSNYVLLLEVNYLNSLNYATTNLFKIFLNIALHISWKFIWNKN